MEKKRESVLTVLMYLFKNHLHDGIELDTELFDELESFGFHKLAIHSAMKWLENLSRAEIDETNPSQNTARTLTQEEKNLLSIECQNYIAYLQNHILSPLRTHTMLDQLFALSSEDIDISLIQWVTLMVLYNQTEHGESLNKMEFLVLEDKGKTLH